MDFLVRLCLGGDNYLFFEAHQDTVYLMINKKEEKASLEFRRENKSSPLIIVRGSLK